MNIPARRPSNAIDPGTRAPRPAPVSCIVGETLRQVRIWTEKEWEQLDPARRPSPAAYLPGLGWIAGTRLRRTN
jgi:hypothetical protein